MAVLTARPGTTLVDFALEEIIGTLRPGDERPHHGVVRLLHKATGVEFVHPLYAILNLYRFMAVDMAQGRPLGRGLGDARLEPHDVDVGDDTVILRWPACTERRLETTLSYTFRQPNCIDMTVRTRAEADVAAFEVFLSSYFEPQLLPHVYLARDRFELLDEPRRFTDDPELVAIGVNDVFRGGVLVYPRDDAAARLCVDGRWDGIARFSPVRRYKLPLCFQTDVAGRVAAIHMGDDAACFAVSSGYASPDPLDRFHKHNPLYLSFFGEPLRPGDERVAHCRLVVCDLDPGKTRPLEQYRAFSSSLHPATVPAPPV